MPWWGWILATAAIFALSRGGIVLTTSGMPLATWWPAAGVSLLFALLVPRRHWVWGIVLIAVVTALANSLGGRSPLLSVIYGVANSLEVAIVLNLLRWRRPVFVLRTLTDAARFVLAIVVGALVLGLVVGFAGNIVNGTELTVTVLLAGASHASAMLLIAPFAVLPPRPASKSRWPEVVVQCVGVVLAIAVAFGPGAQLPLSFLLFVLLTWAALRFPPVVAFAQTVAVAVAVLTLTVSGFGSFVSAAPVATALTTVTFLCTMSIFMVLLVTARSESRRNAIVALNAANAQLEAERAQATALATKVELDRQRDDFVATTSHELRTPITNIIGYTELLLADDLDERRHGWVQVIRRNSERLSTLVEDLLSFGPTATSNAGLPAGVVRVRDLLEEAARAHADRAANQHVRLTVSADASLQAAVDRHTGLKILGHLLSNAIKFTSAGGEVEITGAAIDGRVQVDVRDTGIGMTRGTLESAFQPFYRGADAGTQGTPGTGVGLPIALELTERSGGTLSLASEPGQGTTAILTLPGHRCASSEIGPTE